MGLGFRVCGSPISCRKRLWGGGGGGCRITIKDTILLTGLSGILSRISVLGLEVSGLGFRA